MTAVPVFNLGSSGGGGISMFGTTRYGVDTIAYKWDTISSNAISIANGHWSKAIPIGFRFCTFGHAVDSFLISKTGAISFNLSLRNDTVLNSIPIATHTLPSSNYAASGIFTTNSNVAVNLLNTYTKVRIRNLGTYPCSKLLISFDSIPVLDTACSLRFMHSQIVLYESNLIDVHIKQAPVCNTNTLLLIGLQNYLRDSAFSAPNYNLGNQPIINQAWRFFPNVIDSLKFKIKLYKNRVLETTLIVPATNGSTFSIQIPYIMSGPTPTYDTLHCTLEIFHTAQFCQNSGGGVSIGPVDGTYYKDNTYTYPPGPPEFGCAKSYAGTIFNTGSMTGYFVNMTVNGATGSTNLTNVSFGSYGASGAWGVVPANLQPPYTVSAYQTMCVMNLAGCTSNISFNYTMNWIEIDTLKVQSVQPASCFNNGIGTIILRKPDVWVGQVLPLTHLNSYIDPWFNTCLSTPPGLTQISSYVFKGPPGTYTFEASAIRNNTSPNCNSSPSPCAPLGCKSCSEFITVTIPDKTQTVYTQNSTKYICPGSVYQYNGHSYSAGTYHDTLVNMYGCDSIIQTNVVLSQTYQYNRTVNICQGQTYTDGTSSFTTAGNYTLHYYTKYGCDSIINLTVKVNPVYTKTSYDTICDNMAVFSGVHMYNQTGVYRDTLKTKSGCDSILIEYLTVRSRSFNNIVKSICQGDSFVVAGKIYTKAGNYHDTLVNKYGCDSIIHTNLTVHPIYQFYRSVTICQGQTYVDGPNSFTAAGNYTLHYQSVHGCDSIINLNLVVYPSYSAVHYDTICDNQSLHVGNYVHNQTGVYADTLSTTYGCDSVIIEHLLVKARTFTNIVERRCEGDSVFISNKIYTITGVYHDTLVNSVGCDSIIISNLYFEHPSVDLVALSDTVLGAGETFEFLVNTGYASDSIISLTPVKQIDSIGNNKYSIRANGVVTINIVTETSLGCIASDSLTIREINIVLPTVFTPNGDNQNDIFIIRGGHAYELNRFFIVNRYGEIVFSTNDLSEGWDGKYQGIDQQVGTYQYNIEAHLRGSKKKLHFKGNVQLLR
jgi:gliding motility-associated-like protein